MMDVFTSASPSTQAAFGVALDVALKAAALLILGFAAHAALGRRRALARSALWNSCLIGLLLLPAASAAFPRWRVVFPFASATAAPTPQPESPHFPQASAGPEFGESNASNDDALAALDSPMLAPNDSGSEKIGPPIASSTALASAPSAAASQPFRFRFSVEGLALGAYLTIAALLALRLAVSLRIVRTIFRDCEPATAPLWLEALDQWREKLGVTRRVVLVTSDRISVPIVLGLIRPAVVLPKWLAESSKRELIDAILSHELCHVRRGDYFWNLTHKLTRILYWPHPLIWPIGRIINSMREQACDDLCVRVLGGASYRASLLEVASGLRSRPDPALGMAMARATRLSRRLAWINRTEGAANCLSRWPVRWASAVTIAILAGTFGSIELTRVVAQPPAPATTTNATATAKENAISGPKTVEVTVLAKDTGKPLAGATLRVHLNLGQQERLKTDKDGKAQISRDRPRVGETLNIDAWADGYVQQRHFFTQSNPKVLKIPEKMTISLLPGEETLGGKVVNEQGQPIAGVQVEIWGYITKKEDHELAYMVETTTNAQGEWRCRSFRAMEFANLYLTHPDYLSNDQRNPQRNHGHPRPSDPPRPGEQPMQGLRDFSDVEVMIRGDTIDGAVTDDKGKPVAGAEVTWFEPNFGLFHDYLSPTRSGADGRFQFPHVVPGRLMLQIKAKGYAPELKAIDTKQNGQAIAIKLKPPRTIAGRVQDSQGRPVGGATVVVDGWRSFRSLGVFLETDADGRFHWDEAPSDPILIDIFKQGYKRISGQPVAADEGEKSFVFKRELSINGRVRNAATNQPIEQAQVQIGSLNPATNQIDWPLLFLSAPGTSGFITQGHLQANIDAETASGFRFRITAKGYEPFESRTFRNDEGDVEYDLKLTKLNKPQIITTGSVRRPDGSPLEGAEVTAAYLFSASQPPLEAPRVRIHNGQLLRDANSLVVKTDAKGQFALPRDSDLSDQPFSIIVVHPDFFAEVPRAEFEANPIIAVKPWARIEGQSWVSAKPTAGATIDCRSDRLGGPRTPFLYDRSDVRADSEGRFTIERVVPGEVRVARRKAPTGGSFYGLLAEAKSGETVRVRLETKGRVVIAKIALPPGFGPETDYSANSSFSIESDKPTIPYPEDLLNRRDNSRSEWGSRWWTSAEGREYRRDWFRWGIWNFSPTARSAWMTFRPASIGWI